MYTVCYSFIHIFWVQAMDNDQKDGTKMAGEIRHNITDTQCIAKQSRKKKIIEEKQRERKSEKVKVGASNYCSEEIW